MNRPLPASSPARRGMARLLVNLLVALVVVAVAAATFVFSYDGVRALALLGGMSPRLARYYPGLFDAVLVVACVAAVVLREGRWWARLWAWLVIVVLLAAIGTTDVLHAAGYTLRHRVTEGVVAGAPVVAVLLAFSVLLTLLKRTRAEAPATTPVTQPEQAEPPFSAPYDRPALPAAAPVAEPPTVAVPAVTAGPVPGGVQVRAATTPIALPAGASPQAAPAPPERDDLVPGLAAPAEADEPGPPTRAVPSFEPLREPPTVPPGEMPAMARPATEPAEVLPSAEAPAQAGPAVPGPAPEQPAEAERPSARSGIRYAGGSLGEPSSDYWDAGDPGGRLAGLVYSAREDSARGDGGAEGDPAPEAAGEPADDDSEPGGAGARREHPELDDDAPPFATAPFAKVPRLNRVRSMPAPPSDEDQYED